uniref:DZF domain-containing protein n=1 Tax=Meloidogyne incognita TaxID=6306 RepID=A0A914LZF8_MELIC
MLPHFGAPPVPYHPAPLASTTPGIPPLRQVGAGGPMRPFPQPLGAPVPLSFAGNAFPPQGPANIYPFKPPTFDSYLCESFFPRTTTEAEDTALTQFLLVRHNDIMPTAAEQSAVSALVGKVKQSIDKIIVAPDTFPTVAIEEVREVGSFKKGTMISKHNIADLVIVLKTLPVIESINSLGQKIVQDLKAEHHSEIFGCVIRDFGCEIAGTHAVVRVLVTILPQNINQLDEDLHLPQKILLKNMAALRHSKWFEENASHSVVKALIRLLKHLRNKHEGLFPLNIWCIELLAHYCVMNTPMRTPLPLALAFRRFFQIISTGMLLPSSPAFVDPCEPNSRIHFSLTLEEMDLICSTAQTMLRIIVHGGTEQLFAGEGLSNVTAEMSIWENVVVTPLEKAYCKEDMEPYYGDQTNNENKNDVLTTATAV